MRIPLLQDQRKTHECLVLSLEFTYILLHYLLLSIHVASIVIQSIHDLSYNQIESHNENVDNIESINYVLQGFECPLSDQSMIHCQPVLSRIEMQFCQQQVKRKLPRDPDTACCRRDTFYWTCKNQISVGVNSIFVRSSKVDKWPHYWLLLSEFLAAQVCQSTVECFHKTVMMICLFNYPREKGWIETS